MCPKDLHSEGRRVGKIKLPMMKTFLFSKIRDMPPTRQRPQEDVHTTKCGHSRCVYFIMCSLGIYRTKMQSPMTLTHEFVLKNTIGGSSSVHPTHLEEIKVFCLVSLEFLDQFVHQAAKLGFPVLRYERLLEHHLIHQHVNIAPRKASELKIQSIRHLQHRCRCQHK